MQDAAPRMRFATDESKSVTPPANPVPSTQYLAPSTQPQELGIFN
jgi:hypothetical protein